MAKIQAELRDRVLEKAREILENYQVSYVYGGSSLLDAAACEQCIVCSDLSGAGGKNLVTKCPVCKKCSLDCSHFTHLVLTEAGLLTPYLPTAVMLSATPAELSRRYRLALVGQHPVKAEPGDLLVYQGHVVLLEKLYPDLQGDIIHATSGDLRDTGQGVQRKRFVDLANFRGPLLRILRHRDLMAKSPKLRPFRKVGGSR